VIPKRQHTDYISAASKKDRFMLDSTIPAGFDSHIHFRAPGDLMPAIHAHARRRGLTSSSWLRMVILAALDQKPAETHEKAA